jgi:hypothetical protein
MADQALQFPVASTLGFNILLARPDLSGRDQAVFAHRLNSAVSRAMGRERFCMTESWSTPVHMGTLSFARKNEERTPVHSGQACQG